MPPIEVIYENGVFRPLQPTDLQNGARGQVFVELAPTAEQQQDETTFAASPGQIAYRLLMEIAALPHTPPDDQTDIGIRHDDILYPT